MRVACVGAEFSGSRQRAMKGARRKGRLEMSALKMESRERLLLRQAMRTSDSCCLRGSHSCRLGVLRHSTIVPAAECTQQR